VSIVVQLLENGFADPPDPRICAAALGMPAAYAPDIDLFKSGFGRFSERHDTVIDKKPAVQALRLLAARFWRRRLERAEDDEREKDAGTATQEPDEEWQWTPERIADALESVVSRNFHMIRRARWFCMLSESALAWEPPQTRTDRERLLVFERGRVHGAEDPVPGTPIPAPPGHDRTTMERKRNFDIETYDRMRVVTTELRRLVFEKRRIALRLSPGCVFGSEALRRVLRWV
jgi:hypothetical protein